jgi:hypothetical protein
MAKFRKKPVVIEAVQWFEHGDSPHVRKPEESDLLIADGCGIVECGIVETLKGPYITMPGDWIITMPKGGIYLCKPDIFETTYEPVDFESTGSLDPA